MQLHSCRLLARIRRSIAWIMMRSGGSLHCLCHFQSLREQLTAAVGRKAKDIKAERLG